MTGALLGRGLDAINGLVLGYFFLLNGFYLWASLYALLTLRRYLLRVRTLDTADLLRLGGAPPITLLAPAYNEEATCIQAVRSLLTLEYPEYEVLVVNDGSRDATLSRLTDAYDLVPTSRAPTADLRTRAVRGVYRSRTFPSLWVIDKENGGKADALNVGLAHCRTPLFCAMDADSLLEREALIRIVRPFLEDATTIAAGGIIRIANGCDVSNGAVTRVALPTSFLARIQVMEYLRAFLSGRVAWSGLNATMIVSGAFGVFRRAIVVQAGGFETGTVGEDMELVVRLHRYCRERGIPYRITFVPDPVAWTECPETRRVLAGQRERWHRGLTETMLRHRRMLFNPRFGRVGLFAMPYFFFLEMLGPAIEIVAYVGFGIALAFGRVNWLYAGTFFLLAIALGIALSLAALALEELSFRRYPRPRDLLVLFRSACLEAFGYRQLSTLWRTRGLFAALRGKRGWGAMPRQGFSPRTGA